MKETNQYFVHESSYIDEPCSIGAGSKIWHFCHIMQDCTIGENCTLGQNVMVSSGVVLGNNVKVQNNVSIYSGVVCEDDVFLGPSVVFTNVINPRSAIQRKSEFKNTWVKKGVSIGANATVLCGITLNEHAFIGAGSVVTKNVPAFALITGNPGRQTGWMSKAGARLQFNENGNAICSISGEKYLLKNGQVLAT